jgi:hypothetical protein
LREEADMKRTNYVIGAALLVSLVAIALLASRVRALSADVRSLRSELARVKETLPGLGDFMTTIQLHAGKLWFAAGARNWELAAYELGELRETMEGAKNLQVVHNGVNVPDVLDAVIRAQLAALEEAIRRKDANAFRNAYDESLSACNGCHQEAGRKFIHIVRPAAPPVTNQRWRPPADE